MHFKFLLSTLFLLGGLTLPAQTTTLTISGADEMSETSEEGKWTVINANEDANKWTFAESEGQGATLAQNKSLPQNDWLISTPVTLEGGKTYTFRLFYRNSSSYSSDKQRVFLYVSPSADVEAITSLTPVVKNEAVTKTTWATSNGLEGTFTPEADGTFYVALHQNSKSYMGDCYFQKIEYELQVPHPGAVTDLAVTAAPQGVLSAELAWTMPSVTTLGAPYSGTLGAKVYRGSDSSFATDETSLVGTVENGQSGAAASFTDTPAEAGKYYYKVVTFDANGDGGASKAVQSAWIGKDNTLTAVRNVTATVTADTIVSLTFDFPEGSNGGFVDPADIAYRITRNDVEIAAAYAGELPYTDTVSVLDKYTYKVYTVYNGSTSWSATSSNAVVAGGALQLPWSEDFTTDKGLFTFFYGPDGTKNWKFYDGTLNYWGGTTADAWAVTPPFNLQAGKAYELTFTTYVSRAASPKNLAVCLGTAATAEAMADPAFDETIASGISTGKTVKITVPADGKYYIGFHCHGASNSNDIYVDNVNFTEVEIVPEAVADLTATVGEKGQLSVALSWTNPAKTNSGDELEALTAVTIERGDADGKNFEQVGSAENPVPGQAATFTDTPAAAGIYTYRLTAAMGDKLSEAATVRTTWVGNDTPKKVTNAKAVLSDDATAVTISFDPVAETGVYGGYVDAANMAYKVVRMPDAVEVAPDESNNYIDEVSELPLAKYHYEISLPDWPEIEAVSTNGMVIGSAVALPYTPDFSDKSTFDLWTSTAKSNGQPSWSYGQSKSVSKEYAWYSGTKSWTFTPPFKAQKGTHKLTYKAGAYSSRYNEKLKIVLCVKPVEDETEGQHTVIAESVDVNTPSPEAETVDFEVPADGVYHIGYANLTGDMYLYLMKSDIEATTTGVENIAAEGQALSYDAAAGKLVFGATADVSVFAIDGTLVLSLDGAEGSADVSALPAGIYVARAGAATIKFAK